MDPQVLYDNPDFLVINKPAGWVVHEGAGETGETVADWFVKNYPEVMEHQWDDLGRVGIVHRLDKDTSGVMVLAKSPEILAALQEQFKERSTKKVYQAIVYGAPKDREGEITTFIGRHPKHRQEQAVLPIQHGDATRREAVTEYKTDDTLFYKQQPISLMTFWPHTGRMHQLRVHAKYLGAPILGDQVYNTKPSKRLSKELGLERQLLHAKELTFRHPKTGERVTFQTTLPEDMLAVLKLAKSP